jgi:excisionase family DNA binding protein
MKTLLDADKSPLMVQQRYLSIKQAATYTNLSAKTLYKWAETGQMPACKVGRLWRFDRLELDEFMHGGDASALVYSPACSGLGRKEV